MSLARVYLDSNVFIAAYETEGARSDHAWGILEAIEAGEIAGVTSELTLAEILIHPIEKQDHELVRAYQEIISSGEGFDVIAVNRSILVEAARLRSMWRTLRLPDAIHVASARAGGCKHIISDDRPLRHAPGLDVVQLGPQALGTIRSTPA